jgi:hypothetical protein
MAFGSCHLPSYHVTRKTATRKSSIISVFGVATDTMGTHIVENGLPLTWSCGLDSVLSNRAHIA